MPSIVAPAWVAGRVIPPAPGEAGGHSAAAFLALAQRVWPRDYDAGRAAAALERTVNIGAWNGERLVGTVRVLTDGYFLAVVPEILVDPDYRRQGVGRALMDRALDHAPRGKLFFGAQPQSVAFFERLGYARGPVGFVARRPGGPRAPEPGR